MRLLLPRTGDWDWYVGWFLVWDRIFLADLNRYSIWCRIRFRTKYDLDGGPYYE